MWEWLKSLFSFFWLKEKKLLPVQSPTSGPYRTAVINDAAPPLMVEVEEKPKPSFMEEIRGVFYEAANELALEKAKAEADMLDSGKLQQYIKTTFKYLAGKVREKESGSILISARNAEVPEAVWDTFRDIFIRLSKEMGIKMDTYQEYLATDSDTLKKLLNSIQPQPSPEDRLNQLLNR